MRKSNGYWNNKEKVFEESRNYKTQTEFQRKCSGAYFSAYKHKWLKEMTWFDKGVKPNGYWNNKENVIEESKKYSSRTEFEKKCSRAYQNARINGWLDEMPWLLQKDERYTKNNYVYAYVDDMNKVAYVGRTCDPNNRHNQHKSKKHKSSVREYFNNIGKEIPQPIYLAENVSVTQSQKLEHEWKLKYAEMGYTMLNKGKTGIGSGSIGTLSKKWTKPKVFEEGRKYKTKTEFSSNSSRAYEVARKNGWLKEMYWFQRPKQHNFKWTKKLVFEESRKYKSRGEFEKKCSRAYSIALNNDWLQEMNWLEQQRNTKGYWSKDRVIEESRKYKNATEFHKMCSSGYYSAVHNGWTKELQYKNDF